MTSPTPFLQKLVDTFLPALPATDSKPAIPSASDVGLHQQLAVQVQSNSSYQTLLQQLADVAGGQDAFIDADESTATAVLTQLATQHPDTFQALLFSLKADYFEHPAILAAFQWPTTPPQPNGYPLTQHLNETTLDPVKQKGPIWRIPQDPYPLAISLFQKWLFSGKIPNI